MKYKKIVPALLPMLVVLISLLPVQVALCQSTESVKKIEVDAAKIVVEPVETVQTPKNTESSSQEIVVLDDEAKKKVVSDEESGTTESTYSNNEKIAIGAGAVVLLGGAIALIAGGGDSDPPVPLTPPTAEQLVGAWQASARQPGSGKTYIGTYQLYGNGGLAYNISVSDGQHLVGGGSWRIVEYRLSIRTDHGSLYSGNFTPGNNDAVTLSTSTGWILDLTR